MNFILREAGAASDGGALLGVMTAVFLLFFLGVMLRLATAGRSEAFAEAALLPLLDNEDR